MGFRSRKQEIIELTQAKGLLMVTTTGLFVAGVVFIFIARVFLSF